MNLENYKKVLAKIKADPESWNQREWHCGTQHCFFGHAQLLSGKSANEKTVRRDARLFLQIDICDANYLSASARTIADFEDFIYRNGYAGDGLVWKDGILVEE